MKSDRGQAEIVRRRRPCIRSYHRQAEQSRGTRGAAHGARVHSDAPGLAGGARAAASAGAVVPFFTLVTGGGRGAALEVALLALGAVRGLDLSSEPSGFAGHATGAALLIGIGPLGAVLADRSSRRGPLADLANTAVHRGSLGEGPRIAGTARCRPNVLSGERPVATLDARVVDGARSI